MQDKVTYEFAVIRLVPKVEREEFLNIGVIVFSKRKKYLEMKYKIDEKRIGAFSPSVDMEQLRNYLEAWQRICKGGAEAGPIGQLDTAMRFRWLAAPKSTIIQCSQAHPGLCEAPEEVLEELFSAYVLS
jgi:hypothetical protein